MRNMINKFNRSRIILILIISLIGTFAVINFHGNQNKSNMFYTDNMQISTNGNPLIFWEDNGTIVCNETGVQRYTRICTDGNGGAIITWQDWRNSEGDVFAQRINSSGYIQWNISGVAICTANETQSFVGICSDDNGGAIIIWADERDGGGYEGYAQRVNSSGHVQWETNGIRYSLAAWTPYLCSDGSGGAIIAFHLSGDLFIQRVNSTGHLPWGDSGIAFCMGPMSKSIRGICSDESGGAIITWLDDRNGNYDIFTQRINSMGDILWDVGGTAICTALNLQDLSYPCSDGNGGAIIAWNDQRNNNEDIYAQYINASGHVQWDNNGIPICNLPGDQESHQICSDGSGGAIITWDNNPGVYAQRINALGQVQWVENGTMVRGTYMPRYPDICEDGNGGAYITWFESRDGNNHIFFQFIDASGEVQWDVNGVSIYSLLPSTGQYGTSLCSDGNGGTIITWYDQNNGYDVYAQKLRNSIDMIKPLNLIYHNDIVPIILKNSSFVDKCWYRDFFQGSWSNNYSIFYNGSHFQNSTAKWANGDHSIQVFYNDSYGEEFIIERIFTINIYNESVNFPSQLEYSQNREYIFSINISTELNLYTVFFEWENVNYTITENVSNSFNHTFSSLSAGSFQYRWLFNKTDGSWIFTQLKKYNITKSSNSLKLYLNNTQLNYYLNLNDACNITIENIPNNNVFLYMNESLIDSGISPIANITKYHSKGSYNVTAYYPGNENYTIQVKTLWLFIDDYISPEYQNIVESQINPTYNQNELYQFNCTWVDSIELDTIVFEFNGINYTDILNNSNEYFYNFSDLPANETGYDYRWLANDTSNNWNATSPQNYIIFKDIPSFKFLLNSTNGNYIINQYESVNLSAKLFEDRNIGDFKIEINGSDYYSIFSDEFSNISAIIAGLYNITCTFENENFSISKITHWLTVNDKESPEITHFINSFFLNATEIWTNQTSIEIKVNVTDNIKTSNILICENSSSFFVNRSMISIGNGTFSYIIDIESLNYSDILAYYFYANDTSDNWNINDNSSSLFQLCVTERELPSTCFVNFSLLLPFPYILENTNISFTGGKDTGGSGFSHYEYRINGGTWTMGSSLVISGLLPYSSLIESRCVDNAGNIGPINSINIFYLRFTSDTDGDGLTNQQEVYIYFCNPLVFDTDGDGFSDGFEVSAGSSPTNSLDNPLVRILIIMIPIVIGVVIAGSIIAIKVGRSKIRQNRKQKHQEFILKNKIPISLTKIDQHYKIIPGESLSYLNHLLKKGQVRGIYLIKQKYFIPAAFIDEILKQIRFDPSPNHIDYRNNKPVPEFDVVPFRIFGRFQQYELSEEIFNAILNYLIENNALIGYNDRDTLYLLRGFGIRAFFANAQGIQFELLAKRFQDFDKWAVEIKRFELKNNRLLTEKEANKMSIPGLFLDDINKYVQIQITKPISPLLSEIEKEYYDELGKITLKELNAMNLALNLENLIFHANIGMKDAKILQVYLKEQLKEKITINWPLSNRELEEYNELSLELVKLLKNKPDLLKGTKISTRDVLIELNISLSKLKILMEFIKKVAMEPIKVKFEYLSFEELKELDLIAKSFIKSAKNLLNFDLMKLAPDLKIGIYDCRKVLAYYEWILHDYEPKSISFFLRREIKEFGLKVREVFRFLVAHQKELSLVTLVKDLDFGIKEAIDFLSIYKQVLTKNLDFNLILTSHKKIITADAMIVEHLIENKDPLDINLDELILESNIEFISLWNAVQYLKETKLKNLVVRTRVPKISTQKIEIIPSELELI
ncbi:MAG: hypothetical protein EAX96_09385 [Candidatus Lokiarchaeota archaeon]|nr:hypothetical protein [Candidatus Lokiarchaeota archaeon]